MHWWQVYSIDRCARAVITFIAVNWSVIQSSWVLFVFCDNSVFHVRSKTRENSTNPHRIHNFLNEEVQKYKKLAATMPFPSRENRDIRVDSLCISNWIVAKSMCSVCANKTKMRYDHEIKCVYSVPMAAMLYARSVGFPSIEQTCSIRCVCVCQGGSAKTTPAENCIRKGHAMLRRIQFERRLAATTIAIKPRYERKI